MNIKKCRGMFESIICDRTRPDEFSFVLKTKENGAYKDELIELQWLSFRERCKNMHI
jgi:hypothetical protein